MFLRRAGLALALVALVVVFGAVTASAAKVQIVYWHGWGGEEKQVLDEVVAQFNQANPDIEVEAVTIFGSYDKLLTAIAAGTPPDVTSAVWWYSGPDAGQPGRAASAGRLRAGSYSR